MCGCGMEHGDHGMPMGMMKHHMYKKIIALVVLAGIIFLGIKAFNPENKDLPKDTITVSGKGEVTAKPDIATVSFSVMEENLDVSKATDAVNTKIGMIINNLKSNGVDEKDIKTTDYSIYPRYDYVTAQAYPYNGKQVLAGYDITQSISLKIRDLKKAGKIITDLGGFNVTNMGGLNFTNDKYDDLVRQARDSAIADARAQAEKLAKALGVRLGKITGYSEGGNYPYPVMYDRAMSVGASSAKTEAVLPTGENKITSSVSVTYEIK